MVCKTLRAVLALSLAFSPVILAGPASAASNKGEAAAVDSPQTTELLRWGRCAAAIAVYEVMLKDGGGTSADQALLDRAHAIEPRLEAKANSLADGFTDDQASAISNRNVSEAMDRMNNHDGEADRTGAILAEFKPDMETCIADGLALPDAR